MPRAPVALHRFRMIAPIRPRARATLHRSRGMPAEVRRYRSRRAMQPYVVAVQRQHAEKRVQPGHEAHERERAEEHRHGARIETRTRHRAAGEDAPDTDCHVDSAMKHVHREEAEQLAVKKRDVDRRRVRCRQHQRLRHQAEQARGEIRDAAEESEGLDSRNAP